MYVCVDVLRVTITITITITILISICMLVVVVAMIGGFDLGMDSEWIQLQSDIDAKEI